MEKSWAILWKGFYGVLICLEAHFKSTSALEFYVSFKKLEEALTLLGFRTFLSYIFSFRMFEAVLVGLWNLGVYYSGEPLVCYWLIERNRKAIGNFLSLLGNRILGVSFKGLYSFLCRKLYTYIDLNYLFSKTSSFLEIESRINCMDCGFLAINCWKPRGKCLLLIKTRGLAATIWFVYFSYIVLPLFKGAIMLDIDLESLLSIVGESIYMLDMYFSYL